MSKQTVPARRKRGPQETNRMPWIAGLIIALAVAACVAVYMRSGRVDVTTATATEVNPPTAAAGKPGTNTSIPESKEVAFGPTVPNTTPPPSKMPIAMVSDSRWGVLDGSAEPTGHG